MATKFRVSIVPLLLYAVLCLSQSIFASMCGTTRATTEPIEPFRTEAKQVHRSEVILNKAIKGTNNLLDQKLITPDDVRALTPIYDEALSINNELTDIVDHTSEDTADAQSRFDAKFNLYLDAIKRLKETGALHLKNPKAVSVFNGIVGDLEEAATLIQKLRATRQLKL